MKPFTPAGSSQGTLGRRRFLTTAPVVMVGASTLPGCSAAQDYGSYESIAARIRQPNARLGSKRDELSHELVRLATLAPSSHNTQCWRFALEGTDFKILPDPLRRCPAVDPDDHHLFVSIGCAAENLVHAALAHGQHAEVRFDVARDAVRVALSPTPAKASPLYQAIPVRQCTRGDFDGKRLSGHELALLEHAGTLSGVRVLLLTGLQAMEQVLAYVVQGNSTQMADPAFIRELRSWVRFNRADAARTRDGLFSASSGNPAIPAWLGDLAFGWLFTTRSENDKLARQVRSSAGIAVFVGEESDKAHWVDVGRAYERFALQATALGIRTAFLNQPVEVDAIRLPFAAALGLGGQRPDLVVRFGRGPTLPASLRRPTEAVMD